MIEKHYDYTPYAYVYNNPTRFLDPFGLDSAQRAQAVEKAKEYVKKAPDDYPTFILGGTDAPGGDVDCSGLVGNCIKAGDEPNPVFSEEPAVNGPGKIVNASEEVKNNKDLEEGNVAIFMGGRNGDYPEHSGIVSSIVKDNDGNPTSVKVIHASASKGKPVVNNLRLNSKEPWGFEKVSFYKWDTKPDEIKPPPGVPNGIWSISE